MHFFISCRNFTKLVFLVLMVPFVFGEQKLPSPEEFFGFPVGADYHLIRYSQALEYWKELDSLSGKIKIFEYGNSSFGKPMFYAVISSEENMAHLEKFKSLSERLSLVRGLSDKRASELAVEGKAIVWIDGGLHATEVAPAQHIIQLTYDLLSDESEMTHKIRDEVIALLVLPNPDGMDMVAEWYDSNLGTPFEASPLPWLYQKYIGHDNNRDSFMMSVNETKNINRIVNHEWYPHVFYNHHQRAPFPSLIFVPPDSEPTNPNLPPLLLRWQNFIGAAIAKAFETEGKQGVISRYIFDTWYPGYVTQICDFHNTISTFSETFLYHYATPHFYTVEDFPEEYKDFTISLFFTNPWKGGWWRLRDAVEYCLTSSKAVLEIAAKHRKELLHAKYSMGKETIARYKSEPPYGWIIPRKQRDTGAVIKLLDILLDLDIEVFEAEEDFRADGRHYPAGSFILLTSQPFGRLLKTLFEIQEYPDLRKYPFLWQAIVDPLDLKVPPLRTYDVLGWTLPLQMGVETVALNTPFQAKVKLVDAMPSFDGMVTGTGKSAFLLPYESVQSVIAVNRILKSGGQVFWAKDSFESSGKSYPPGTVFVPQSSISAEKMKSLAKNLSLQVRKIDRIPSVKSARLQLPRVALYKPWVANMDEGWTRLILENFEFSYTSLDNAEIKAGHLEERYDAIILPNQSSRSILNGHSKGTMPPRYVGGIGKEGTENLKSFVEKGGTLVALGASCDFPVESFDLPLKNVLKDLKPEDFFASGLLVRVTYDTNHPVAFGMPDETSAFFAHSPAFQIWPGSDEKTKIEPIAVYPEENIVLSGWMFGEKYLKNRVAAYEAQIGKGKVISLGFRVQHRGQTWATFKLLFNSLFYASAGLDQDLK